MLSISDTNLPLTANTSPITTVEGVAAGFLLSFTLSRARGKCDGGKTESTHVLITPTKEINWIINCNI